MRELAEGSAADTIFALASGAGRGAISVVRISGGQTGRIMRGMCGRLPAARVAGLRHVRDMHGALLDQALVVWMPGPGSYTGEDCAELSLHGGRAILAAVSAALVAAGARPAGPGEFTRRAFLHGKMDLLEAEAIADLVAAETEAQRIQALRQLQGGQSDLLNAWAEQLKRNLAFQEALIDFPDENLPVSVEAELASALRATLVALEDQLALAAQGQRLRDGLVFTISGPPNVGKSSLMNALARRDIAIVSPLAGTTRDSLETSLDLGGVKVTLVDTAGLRLAEDEIEAEGVRRARARAESADLVLHMVDAREAPGELPSAGMVIANKIDLASAPAGCLGISVKTGEGMAALQAALIEQAKRLAYAGAEPVLTRARHVAALRDAIAALQAALGSPLPELRAEDLRHALAALGRITGVVESEDVLDVVFGAFCIGK